LFRDSSVFLSIIIPAYNEETRLPGALEQIAQFLNAQPYTTEVLIVENGSTDLTCEIAGQFAAGHSQFRLIRETQRGKGRAVRTGMLQACGEYRFMCDVDLSMPIEEVNNFLPPVSGEIDIAIASREANGAVRYNEPFYRHLGGRAINTLIRWTILPGLNDTQCGFKCFSRRVAEDIFKYQTITGWSFDIELLYIARRRGYRILEVPIHWYFNPNTKLNAFRDAIKMLGDIMQIRRNWRQGLYNPTP
jgi:dolichyl-phosphate beta-glucosyltransferase